jgi:hypothetical protein
MVTTLIQCTSIWFAGSKFGLSWKAKQIRMDKVPESIRGYAFIDDDDVPARSSKAAPAPSSNKFAALNTEVDEEDEGEEDEAFQAPAPTPSKPNVLQAMMPKAPAPAPSMDEDGEDHEPIPVPAMAKKVVSAKKVAAKATPAKK